MGKNYCITYFAFVLLLFANMAQAQVNYDSTQLTQDSIYTCDGHFFEWCTEPSTCAHCNEDLTKTSLWDYFKKLECEDCKKFFEENYLNFIEQKKEL